VHQVGLDATSLQRAIPVAVSCGLHALVVAFTLAITFLTPASEPRVIFAELVPLEAPPPPAAPPGAESEERPKPAPVTPPRLIRKPTPAPPPIVSEPLPSPVAIPMAAPPAPLPAAPSLSPRAELPAAAESLLPLPSFGGDSAAPSSPASDAPTIGRGPGSDALASAASADGASRSTVARGTPGAVEGVTQVARPHGGYQVRPSYPAAARRVGAQGTTVLRVFVAEDGRVTKIVVQESAGHADLDRAAADAVARWRFDPARRGAQPVGMWVLLPVQFQLR
jgi:protein TonB